MAARRKRSSKTSSTRSRARRKTGARRKKTTARTPASAAKRTRPKASRAKAASAKRPTARRTKRPVATRPTPSGSRRFGLAATAEPPLGTTLKLRQRVPDREEVAVVGAIKDKVLRGTPEFAALVRNDNPRIVFKDEEGTGADRMMTPRMKEGLDRLADLVRAEWTGIKLRVTEAWDETNEHHGRSLHYEGRGADLTTSDKDGAKLGRLARLAVDAGLGWVFFEDSRHVHVSVRR